MIETVFWLSETSIELSHLKNLLSQGQLEILMAGDDSSTRLSAIQKIVCGQGQIQNAGADCRDILIFTHDHQHICGLLHARKVFEHVELDYIIVRSLNRGSGIATDLMNKFISYSQEVFCTNILLEVSSLNESAVNLYKKFNFEQIRVRKAYYKNGSDALIMERKL